MDVFVLSLKNIHRDIAPMIVAPNEKIMRMPITKNMSFFTHI